MKVGASKKEVDHVTEEVKRLGFRPNLIHGKDRTVIACIGHEKKKKALFSMQSAEGVESVVPISKPYKLASRETSVSPTVITVEGGVEIGGPKLCIMAGPCSVENERQILDTARAVKKAGAQILRGGAFKPRTSPYDFQ